MEAAAARRRADAQCLFENWYQEKKKWKKV
jgi:hypothetical protein